MEQDGEGGGNVGMLGRLSGFLGLRLPLQSAPARQGGEWRNAGEAEAGEEDDKEVDGAEEVRVQVADTRRTDLVTIPICVLCPVSCILSRPHTPSRSQHWRNTVHVSCAWPPFFLSFLPVDTAPVCLSTQQLTACLILARACGICHGQESVAQVLAEKESTDQQISQLLAALQRSSPRV